MTTPDDALAISFATDADALMRLAKGWGELEAAAGAEASIFQSHAWCRAIVSARRTTAPDIFRPAIATARREGRLVALWPLTLQRKGFCWIARALDHPFGQFAGLLAVPGTNLPTLGARLIRALKAADIADGLLVAKVAGDCPLRAPLEAAGAEPREADQAPYIDLRPHADFDAYLQTLRAPTRKSLCKARNRLSRDHGIRHQVITEPAALRRIVDETFAARLAWMRRAGRTSPAFRDPAFKTLIETLPEAAADLGLIGFRLATGDGRTIALQWGFRRRGRYDAYLSARNPAFDGYSAGRVHLGMMTEAAAGLGVRRLELMSPASDDKLDWTRSLTAIEDFSLALTPAGRLYLDLWRGGLRQRLKQVYYLMPGSLRPALAHPGEVPARRTG
jgi:CelD/BcsL family acetyltransferase involved in cellulose biosynthesis